MTLTTFSLCWNVVINLRRGNARVMAGRTVAINGAGIMVEGTGESRIAIASD